MPLPRFAVSGLVLAVLACGGLAALTGCGSGDAVFLGDVDADAVRDTGSDADSAGTSLAVGDCVNVRGGSLLAGVDAVSCERVHDWEVYYRVDIEATGFPGDDMLVATAEETCAAEFLPFLGLATDSGVAPGVVPDAAASFGYAYLTPPESDWPVREDHEVLCLIGDMSGQVTGSLAGAAATAAG